MSTTQTWEDLQSLLHVRGGVSSRVPTQGTVNESSPRPWRCFQVRTVQRRSAKVFSTSVEVFPPSAAVRDVCKGLLHVRGGVSLDLSMLFTLVTSSPRPWRCFSLRNNRHRYKKVFSTSVEVFPQVQPQALWRSGLLHVRGGVSAVKKKIDREIEVFSTSVEVFLVDVETYAKEPCLLHVRGGVSLRRNLRLSRAKSSPRPWRCFLKSSNGECVRLVFSTSVEVFLKKIR